MERHRRKACLLVRTKRLARRMGLDPAQVTCGQANLCGSREAGSCPRPIIDVFNARLSAGTTRALTRRAS
jgi:hypothetical protein